MGYNSIATREWFDGQIAEIGLGPPPGNIVTASLMGEVATELKAMENSSRSRIKLIIVRGQGEHFSYGASVEEHRPDQVGRMLPRFHALLRQVLACPIPTLAQVSGACLGGGFELALACSMMACDEAATLGVPEIRLGVFPPAASVLLPYKTTHAHASAMILTGRNYSGQEIHSMGIANILAGAGKLDETVAAFVEKQIIPKSASSLRLAWQASRRAMVQYYDAHIAAVERLYLDTLMSTQDAVEGIEAFLEKRTPTWRDA
jgi:cyclohexa-1,5-dienecarbonyl-CoA hydratase